MLARETVAVGPPDRWWEACVQALWVGVPDYVTSEGPPVEAAQASHCGSEGPTVVDSQSISPREGPERNWPAGSSKPINERPNSRPWGLAGDLLEDNGHSITSKSLSTSRP